MASRKTLHSGFIAGTQPTMNIFTSMDDDAADESTIVEEDGAAATERRLAEQRRIEDEETAAAADGNGDEADIADLARDLHLSTTFPAAVGPSGHVVSAPYEICHYPIEINENKIALQRQITNRRPQPSMSSTAGSPISNSLCVSPLHMGALSEVTAGVASVGASRSSEHLPSSAAAAEESKITAPSKIVITDGNETAQSSGTGDGAAKQKNGVTKTNGTPVDSETDAVPPLFALGKRCSIPQHVEMHAFRDAIDVNYQRMALTDEELSGVPLEDLKIAAKYLVEGLRLRQEYMELIGNHFPTTTKNFLTGYFPQNLPKSRKKNTEVSAHTSFNPPEPPADHWGVSTPLPVYDKIYKLQRGHGTVTILDDDGEVVESLRKFYVTKEKYLNDYERLIAMIADGPLKSFSYRRLTFLQTRFQMHVLLNEIRELHEQKSVPHRDFYNIRKVDTHIHAASSMNQKHLLRFIKKKMKLERDVVVMEENGKKVTMQEMFDRMGISTYDLSVDLLDVHADRNTFHRFDKFNTKYNPVGQNALRDVFIKTDNYVGGKYFAEVLKEVFSDLEDSKYQQAEPRLSIYGRSKDEWDKLARWAISNDVWSTNVRFIIQIPRLFDIYKTRKMIANFDEFLDNLFTPLFEVTNDPSSHPELFYFLQCVTGFDSVDDESKHEYVHFDRSTPEPADYIDKENPPYSYYMYYTFANITALNAFRRMRGMNTFAQRVHCGEAGPVNHLICGYLTSESIAHGLLLRKVPVLQYLFYLAQIGIAMSPLSNNSLFISYPRNPLPEYLMKGMNVSLSTDDPLQFHFTKEALMEEYSIAAQVWKLSSCDMCELARNSVLQSGFEDKVKIHWLGPNYREEGVLGNDVARTNVPDIRISFRHETLVEELHSLFRAVKM